MRSESTSAFGQPKLTKPTLGVLRITAFNWGKVPWKTAQFTPKKPCRFRLWSQSGRFFPGAARERDRSDFRAVPDKWAGRGPAGPPYAPPAGWHGRPTEAPDTWGSR